MTSIVAAGGALAILASDGRIDRRPPSPRDDITRGYKVGDVWIENRRMYKCLRNTAGKAVWLGPRPSIGPPPRPMDVAPGVIAAYGTIPLAASYSGAAIAIERQSDAVSLELGFVGSRLDEAAMDAHVAASEARVASWTDQSGGGYHATATGAARPTLSKIDMLGSHRGILIDNNYSGTQEDADVQYLTLPDTLTVSSQAATVITYFKAAHGWRGEGNFIHFTTDTGTNLRFGISPTGGLAIRGTLTGASPNRSLSVRRVPLNPRGYALGLGASGTGGYLMQSDVPWEAIPTLNSITLKGAYIGAPSPYRVRGAFGAILIYNRRLTPDEVTAVFHSLDYHFDECPQARGNLVGDGDSLTEGPSGEYLLSYMDQIRRKMALKCNVFNVGVSGAGWANQTDMQTRWAGAYQADAPWNELHIMLGTNDIGSGGAAKAAIQKNVEAYFASHAAAGRNWDRIVVSKILPRGLFAQNPGMLSRWYDCNGQLVNEVANLRSRDKRVVLNDWGEDPTLTDLGWFNDPSLTLPADTTHYNVDGATIVAESLRSRFYDIGAPDIVSPAAA